MAELQQITPKRLAKLSEEGSVDVIDVRTPVEFREVHASLARNVPLDALDPDAFMTSRNGSAGQPIYVLCRTGARAKKACDQFLAAGHDQVVHVEGGTVAWEEAGLPVNRGKKAMSLERQVRIAAGLLVLICVALSLFVHPYAIGLSAFVGAGLVFAGITDTCGMGMVLARMPWNHCEGPSCSA